MRMWVAAIAATMLAGCGPAATAPEAFRASVAGETRLDGKIEAVEDGGYPQYTVTMTPGGGAQKSLYLNAESGADLGEATPESFAGKDGVVYFKAVDKLDLLALTADGKALIEATAAAGDPTVTGVLSGAAEPTAGDLPDTITVTDASGKSFAFDYYVTPEIAAANGKKVVATYEPATVEEVTLMRVK